MKASRSILPFLICLSQLSFSQLRFSSSTDLSILRDFTRHQQFFSFGQEITLDFHLNSGNGIYALFSYYSPEKKNNDLLAIAKSSSTVPQEISFLNHSKIRLKQFSLGWKHYLRGTNDADNGWNLYAIAGFGIIFGTVTNEYSATVDTSLYNLPSSPVSGAGHFKRLTLDLGLGWEIPLVDEIYLYSEAKTWIPTTEYPSKYLFINNNAPFAGTISAGIRILF